jgi:alkylation response protein AidB-like acyl-CoA dehydrogenase
MDFSWSTEQLELRDNILDFARKELESDVGSADANGEFNLENWRKCADFGIHGLMLPETYGGLGCDPLTAILALETLGYACRDNGLLFSINAHMWTCSAPILAFGTDVQKNKYLPGLCDGSLIGGNAMTEPSAGSDAYQLRTTATPDGDSYVLNGSKTFITNAPIADLLVVFATVDRSLGKRGISAFIVEKDSPGLSINPKKNKLGIRTSPWADVFFDDCRIPSDNILGKVGSGTALFTHSMTWERGLILATAVGAMQRQLETCAAYTNSRKQFDEPISNFQLVQDKLVKMKLNVETARLLLYKLGWLRTEGKSGYLESALTKLHISESWVESSLNAVQIHGGYGYTTEFDAERELRDAIASRIYSGTSEIQKLIAASLL